MVTTKQDGDTEVSAWKATESRNEVQKVSEKTPSQNDQCEQTITKYGIRSAESDERTVQSR